VQELQEMVVNSLEVSNQFVSPASGEVTINNVSLAKTLKVSNQFVSPASGEIIICTYTEVIPLFPINLFPQRVGSWVVYDSGHPTMKFPINLFPQRVGSFKAGACQFRSYTPVNSVKANVSNQFVSPASGENHKQKVQN